MKISLLKFKKFKNYKKVLINLFLASNLTLIATGSAELNLASPSASSEESTSSAQSDQSLLQIVYPARTFQLDPTGLFYEDEIEVRFKDDVSQEIKLSLANGYNAKIVRELPRSKLTLLQVDSAQREEILASLENNPNIEYAEKNYIVRVLEGSGGGWSDGYTCWPNDYYYCLSSQWGLLKIRAKEAWNIKRGTSSNYVAVLDSGIDYRHRDLGLNNDGAGGKVVKGFDFTNPWESPNDPIDDSDVSHGTAVASIIGAKTDSIYDIAGIDWYARLLAIKVVWSNGQGEKGLTAEGIYEAVDGYNGRVKVINLSQGFNEDVASLRNAVNYAISKGVYVVAAVNNSTTTNCFMGFPAAYPGVISVVATNRYEGFASGCTGNVKNGQVYQKIQIAAPGKDIYVLKRNGLSGYFWGSHTSFATPFVTGVVSVLKSCSSSPYLDLVNGAADLGASGWDSTYGYGRLDMYQSLLRAKNRGECP